MAVTVSHAMRRFPTSSPDAVYGLRGENWSSRGHDEGESSLSRSMRYAEPWLYGSVRSAAPGLLVAPAFALCHCPDYTTGTKRKKHPTTCKKCKGARLPFAGTVRYYPAPATTTPVPRAGTVRATASSRPSILPTTVDPYDLMRRSRLAVPDSGRLRARSASPGKAARRLQQSSQRRSILECDVNPYELMAREEAVPSARFKSILKKKTEAARSVTPPTGSQFYIPTPHGPRKKVQFVEDSGSGDVNRTIEPPPENHHHNNITEVSNEPNEKRECKLKRSASDHYDHQSNDRVVFYDTMALRTRTSRINLNDTDLERLDGLKNKKISPRPVRPPPPPPPSPPILQSAVQSTPKIDGNPECIKKEDCSEKPEALPIHPELPETPPCAPPRKRSNNKQPQINIVTPPPVLKIETQPPIDHSLSKTVTTPTFQKIESLPLLDSPNKTVLEINSFPEVHKLQIRNEFPVNVQTVSVIDNPQRKTSILINGDDCYCTVNVNDDVPLYQSSVVVNESPESTPPVQKKSSSVYITGNFVEILPEIPTEIESSIKSDPIEAFNERDIPSTEKLSELLKDPVEAVRRNLVPHVCGKSDIARRPNEKVFADGEEETTHEVDECSEHGSSTQYEPMEAPSECYTDNSNRSSVTEEELSNRTKFYELLADSAVVEVADSDDHHYESIKNGQDPIYEEIEIPPPLPANPPPTSLLDDLQLDKEYTTRSIFEGASKYDILSYLVDAKERGIVPEDTYTFNFANSAVTVDEDTKESYNRVSQLSTVSDSSEDNSLIIANTLLADDKFQKSAEVERNDSGVGSETSKSSLSKYRTKQEVSVICEDCETTLDVQLENEPLICRKCKRKRSERKEIIMEIVETEEKYSRDLQIILEEFYQPMLVAGLLTADQLSAIFLNVEELLENSQSLAERLRDAVEIAVEQGDEDLLTVNIGKLFLEAAPMLHGFETYCVRQGAASLLLASLEKEKELLRIFLRVSQMENTMLRRMNLNSFLMVPVQRVTKYPLLLARLIKVTPNHHETKEVLKEAQHKIELHLNHMNSETKDVPSKLWRRIGNTSCRRSSAEMDLVNIKLRKIAVDVLEWNHDEAKFAMESKLLFTQPSDNNWRKGRTIKLSPINALLVINGKLPTNRTTEENGLIFGRPSAAREAALLLVRDKNGRYSLLREPLYLDRCIIAADPAWQSYFEVQEIMGKDTFIFKAEDEDQTKSWYNQLQYHAQGLGAWRKRRNALANIMINGMGREKSLY